MPFLEFLGYALVVVLCIGVLGFAIVFFGSLGLFLFGACLLLGWIPIFMCASDPLLIISFSGNFIEAAAAWSTVAYLVGGVGFTILWFTVPHREALPHGLQMLAFLFPHPAEPHVHRAIETRRPVDGRAMAASMRATSPTTRTGERMRTHNAGKLTKDVVAETERRRADSELREATVEMEKARARLEEARKRAGKR